MRLADAAEAELKALVVRRRQLLGMLVAETNRRQRAPKVVRKSIVQTIKGLKRALAALAAVVSGIPCFWSQWLMSEAVASATAQSLSQPERRAQSRAA